MVSALTPSWAMAALEREVQAGAVAQAYLFTGAAGLGQVETARTLVHALLCRNRRGGRACGECPACHKLAAGNHPDLHWVAPEGATLKFEQVRAVLREAWYRPLEGERRCFVLEDAGRLSTEAANRLLKILEEPPAHALFILIAEAPTQLPATIVSRCRWLPFRPLPVSALARELERNHGLNAARARLVARLAGGNPGLARRFLELEQFPELCRRVVDLLGNLARGGPVEALAAADELATLDAETLLLVLTLLEHALREVWLFAAGLPLRYAVGVDEPARLREVADQWGAFDYEAAMQQVARARWYLRSHVQTQHALDALFLSLQNLRGSPG